MDSALRNVDLFDSVTTIGARAFAGCTQLEALTLPELADRPSARARSMA